MLLLLSNKRKLNMEKNLRLVLNEKLIREQEWISDFALSVIEGDIEVAEDMVGNVAGTVRKIKLLKSFLKPSYTRDDIIKQLNILWDCPDADYDSLLWLDNIIKPNE